MKHLLTTLFVFCVLAGSAQKEDYVWILGETLTPDSILAFDFSNGQADTVKYDIHLGYFISSANISDTNGKLLFVSNGLQVVNAQGTVISGGSNLEGVTNNPHRADAVPNGCIILPAMPLGKRYVVLHEPLDFVPNDIGNEEQPLHLYYSVVDMELNQDEGLVLSNKNTVSIVSDTLVEGRLAACRHANGRYWWVLTHEYYSNRYYRILVKNDSVVYDGEQVIGSKIHWQDPLGQANFSLDGSKYAMIGFTDTTLGDAHSAIELFDFDRCSGLLNNHRKINMPMAHPNQTCPGGCSFSPNGRFIYASSYNKLYQYDILLDELLEVTPLDSPAVVGYFQHHQLAPDGKIYICSYATQTYLQTISNPDVKGQGCNLRVKGYPLTRWNGTIPTFSNYRLGALPGSPCDTITSISPKSSVQREHQIKLYPNPATDVVMVDYGFTDWSKGAVTLQLTNALGQVVFTQNLPLYSGFQKLNISPYPAGTYRITLLRGNQTIATATLVKE